MLVSIMRDGTGIIIDVFTSQNPVGKRCQLRWGQEESLHASRGDFIRAVKKATEFSASCFICTRITVCTDYELHANGGQFMQMHGKAREKQQATTQNKKSPTIVYKNRRDVKKDTSQ